MDRKGCADVPECDLDKEAPCTVSNSICKFVKLESIAI